MNNFIRTCSCVYNVHPFMNLLYTSLFVLFRFCIISYIYIHLYIYCNAFIFGIVGESLIAAEETRRSSRYELARMYVICMCMYGRMNVARYEIDCTFYHFLQSWWTVF